MNGYELKRRRLALDITGDVLCKRAGINRTRLSNIERGYVVLSGEEADRLRKALDEIAAAKKQVTELAASLGFAGVNTIYVQ